MFDFYQKAINYAIDLDNKYKKNLFQFLSEIDPLSFIVLSL